MQIEDRPNITLSKYLAKVEVSKTKTAEHYRKRLNYFRVFVLKKYSLSLDELITTLTNYSHGPKIDIYDLLSEYASYLIKRSIQPITVKLYVTTARGFLEYCDVDISARKFRLKVGMPRVIRSDKEALQKSDVQIILNSCHNIQIKTYVLYLASTGCRASEALSLRLCDINFDADPATIFIRGEFTKTGKDRTIEITHELAEQLKMWREYKHRTRETKQYDEIRNKIYVEKITPKIESRNLLFSIRYNQDASVYGLYGTMLLMFEDINDRLGGKFAELESSGRRHKFTFHSLRRHAKTTISNLGYGDYSDYYLGHSGSTYYRNHASERIKLFKKIEPFLTYLDQSGLEQKQTDLQSRLESMEHQNMELKQFQEEMRKQFTQVMEMIQRNPKLANVKPEVLREKKLDKR